MKKLLTLLFMMMFVSCYIVAQENVIDEIVWVVGDDAILRSDIERLRLDMQMQGERIEGDPYCFIPEQLAIQKLY
jgi:peptidyl-prolyl cis-trans isomerase SurA